VIFEMRDLARFPEVIFGDPAPLNRTKVLKDSQEPQAPGFGAAHGPRHTVGELLKVLAKSLLKRQSGRRAYPGAKDSITWTKGRAGGKLPSGKLTRRSPCRQRSAARR